MKFIVANWKMNHDFDAIDKWIDEFYKIYSANYSGYQEYNLILCPPAIFLDYIDSELIEDGFKFLELIAQRDRRQIDDFSAEEINRHVFQGRPIKLGGQDCHLEEEGAFTGEISAAMLKEVGCEYVILGHSERRFYRNESNKMIVQKSKIALDNNLTPIICIGETKQIRDEKKHFEFIKQQLMESTPNDIKISRLIIAYEPIWAIGTGETASVEQITEMENFIKEIFERELAGIADEYFLLYGGSVNFENSIQILEIGKIDGLLVGKTSLDAKAFMSLCPVKKSNEDSAENNSENSQSNLTNKNFVSETYH